MLQSGTRKGTRYRLTNPGIARAEELIAQFVVNLP
jgi:hypothetical protein